MLSAEDPIIKQIEMLSEAEKFQLVDMILMQLNRPDPEIDKIWANEAKARWSAYKEGKLETVSLDEVLSKHRTS